MPEDFESLTAQEIMYLTEQEFTRFSEDLVRRTDKLAEGQLSEAQATDLSTQLETFHLRMSLED